MTLDDQTEAAWLNDPLELGTGLMIIDDVKVYAPQVTHADAVQWAHDKKAEALKWVPHRVASLDELQGCRVPQPGGHETAVELLDAAYQYGYEVNGVHIVLDFPECLMCGANDFMPSMDGPLICSWCDMGKNRDGSPWSAQEAQDRRSRKIRRVQETRIS